MPCHACGSRTLAGLRMERWQWKKCGHFLRSRFLGDSAMSGQRIVRAGNQIPPVSQSGRPWCLPQLQLYSTAWMRMQIREFLQQALSGLRLVSVLLPLGEQRELVLCPIGPAGWHGRRVVFVGRKCSKHFLSMVRIRHEGVVIQVYLVTLHVRNIDGAKQWLDVTRE